MTSGEDFFYHLYRATGLYDDGHLADARAELDHARAIDPNDARASELSAKLDSAGVASHAAHTNGANGGNGTTNGASHASHPTPKLHARRVADLIELSVPADARVAVRLESLRAFGATDGALLERKPKIAGASALLGGASRPFVALTGSGTAAATSTAFLGPRAGHRLESLAIETDGPLFVREDLLVAFDLSLVFECARLAEAELDVVQLRLKPSSTSRFAAILDPPAVITRVAVSAAHPLHIRRDRLVAWTGRILPQPIAAGDALASQRGLVRFGGDGTVLLSLA